MQAPILVVKMVSGELACRAVAQQRSRLTKPLQPFGHAGRIANDRALSGASLADQIADNYKTGGDTDPGQDRLAIGSLERRHPVEDRKPGAQRAFGIVLERIGIPEIGEDTVSYELRDIAAKTHLVHADPQAQRPWSIGSALVPPTCWQRMRCQ